MFSKQKYSVKVILILLLIRSVIAQNEEEFSLESEDYLNEDKEDFSGDGVEEELEENYCSAKQLITNLNVSHYLPDDYEVLKEEKITRIVPHINQTFAKFERLMKWGLKIYNNKELNEALRTIISRSYDMVYELDLEPECLSSFLRVANAIQNRRIWALKFVDAIGKLPSGLLEGVFSSFGEYDECLDIESPPEDGSTILGQYCLLKPVIPYPKVESYDPKDEKLAANDLFELGRNILKENNVDKYGELNSILKLIEQLNIANGTFIRLGICLPHKCSPQDIQRTINKILYPIIGFPVEINQSNCYIKNSSFEFDSYQLFSIIIFSILIGLVLLSTSYEIYLNYYTTEKENIDNETMLKVLLSFSIITNTNKLLEKDDRLAAIDTIRLILAFGLGALQIYNYTPLSLALKSYSNSVPKHMLYFNRYFFARTPGLWIDPFALIVGLVLSYTIINKLEKSNGNFNYLTYLFQRWVRISVSLFGSILMIYLMPLIGSGPIWNDCNIWLQPSCRDIWSLLSSFLYYSNWNAARHNYPLTNSFEICNLPTWFLSASFQFYIIAPLLFLTLYKWPKVGLKINIAIILLGVFLNVSPKVFLNDLTYFEPTRLPSVRLQHKYFNNYHVNSFQYVCTFFMGMFTGYIMRKHPKIYIGGPIVENTFNIIAIAIIPLIYMWNNTFWILNDSPPEISVLLFFAFGKFFWGLSFAWICFACSTGRAVVINGVLSMRWIQPIAKLYYLIYLLRLPIIFYRIFTVKETFIMTDYQTFQNLIADFIITVIFAYFLYILMERPVLNILKIMENQNKVKQSNDIKSYMNDDHVVANNNNNNNNKQNINITKMNENHVTRF